MQPSGSEVAQGFSALDPRIQRWIWTKGWTGLRDAQERAIPPILEARRDVIIAAATAAGKTEAAFLPALSRMASLDTPSLAVYISPLVALINDQWGRLDDLCEQIDVPVTPWHGDIGAGPRRRFMADPHGVLLITPESLEAMFIRRGPKIPVIFRDLRYVVIDEMHAFIGTDRGKQLQSLMRRIEISIGRSVPRIGLSATLGDMAIGANYLRPGKSSEVVIVESTAAVHSLKVQVRGYVISKSQHRNDRDAARSATESAIADHLFASLRGSNNLLFPNSRGRVEHYADLLRRRCEDLRLPNEFWPHHGSLSREIREATEMALREGDRPATGICTNTLELGIDIGSIKSIAQIGPPPSVASLRQRLGRSGRRPGEDSILRCYCLEQEYTPDLTLSEHLRESLLQTTATVRLLLDKWCEPPTQGLNYSTLVQQVLSIAAQFGGFTADQAYRILVKDGAFPGLGVDEFIAILREMAKNDLLMQEGSGLLLPGGAGERAINSRDIYAAFMVPEEWRIVTGTSSLGSLPMNGGVWIDQLMVFAGRRWRVTDIDEPRKILTVVPDRGGVPPIFEGSRPGAHDRVRLEMKKILEESEPIPFLDPTAQHLVAEARTYFRDARLEHAQIIPRSQGCEILTWRGDRANDALALLLRAEGIEKISNEGLTVYVEAPPGEVLRKMRNLLERAAPEILDMLQDVKNLGPAKWDWTLPPAVLIKSYAATHLDLYGAMQVIAHLVEAHECRAIEGSEVMTATLHPRPVHQLVEGTPDDDEASAGAA